jgi:hypothetical protein
MSIDELERKQQELKAALVSAKKRRAGWQRKLAAAKAQLKEAMLSDNTTDQPTLKVQEAHAGVQTFTDHVRELEVKLKPVEQALRQAQYEQRRGEVFRRRNEAHETLRQAETELLEAIQRVYEESWAAQDEVNAIIEDFNRNEVARAGASALSKIKRMNGLSAFDYVDGLIRAALHEGRI